MSSTKQPVKKLSTYEIYCLPHELQATALALLGFKDGCTLEEIRQETDETLNEITRKLRSLEARGFVGTKKTKKKMVFFCII